MQDQSPENRPETSTESKQDSCELSDPMRNSDNSASVDERPPAAQTPQLPNAPVPDHAQAVDQFDLMELNSARTLTTVATIAGPVSFIIGGVALSTVAVVCAILALTKARRVLRKPQGEHSGYANMVRQTAIMGLLISSIALILNIVGLVTMLPILMEAMQTGDYSAILGDAASSIQGTAPSSGSSGGGNAWG